MSDALIREVFNTAKSPSYFWLKVNTRFPLPISDSKCETSLIYRITSYNVCYTKLLRNQKYDGDFAVLKTSLINASDMLNKSLHYINFSADNVNSGAEQVSAVSQTLSQGATEQASSIQELSATLNEITSKINNTAKNANKAKQISNEANDATVKGQEQMHEMVNAMNSYNFV